MKTLAFWALTKQQQEQIHQMRLSAHYHYKKDMFTLDETYYYNVYLENL